MVLIILAINVLPQLVKIAGPYSLRQKDLSIKITVKEHHELDGIFKQIKNLGMHVKRVKIKDIDSGAFQQLEMVILAPEDLYTTELYSSLKEIDRVVSVEVESRYCDKKSEVNSLFYLILRNEINIMMSNKGEK